MTADVAVVGGGISGMIAAHRLAERGARVTLVERSATLGGIVETTHDDGFVIEGGPDSFVPGKGTVLGLAADLGLEGEVIASRVESRGSYVWWEGRLHPLPGGLLLMVPSRLRSLLGSSLLSWKGKARVLADLVLPRAVHEGDESLESFVRRRLGAEVLERIAEPLIAGIHAAEPGTMSLRASFPRFLEMEAAHRSLILAARAASATTPGTGVPGHFASFRTGMGRLTSRLAETIDHVEVRTGATVTGIDFQGAPGYHLSFQDGGRLRAGAVVLAIPAPVASGLLAGVAPEASRALEGVGQVSNAAVTLAYNTDDLPSLNGSGFVVPSAQRRRIRGVSYLSHKWEGRVPGREHTLLRVFLGAGAAPTEQGPHLLRVVGEELEAMVGITAPPVRWWLRVHEQGLHRYTLGHLERVAIAERALAARGGLALAGAGFHGVGLNECIDSGRRAADAVLDSKSAFTSTRTGQ